MKISQKSQVNFSICAYIAILVFVAACQPVAEIGSDTSSPRPAITPTAISERELTQKWLSGQPCSPPCWENIEPGQTKADQAIAKSEENPLFININETRFLDLHGIEWELSVLSETGVAKTLGARAYINRDNFVYGIHVQIADTKLGDFIKSFDQPSHIIAIESPAPDIGGSTLWSIHIIWLNKGLDIEASGGIPSPKVEENLIFDAELYFEPSDEGFKKVYPTMYSIMREWQGYGDFQFYAFSPNNP